LGCMWIWRRIASAVFEPHVTETVGSRQQIMRYPTVVSGQELKCVMVQMVWTSSLNFHSWQALDNFRQRTWGEDGVSNFPQTGLLSAVIQYPLSKQTTKSTSFTESKCVFISLQDSVSRLFCIRPYILYKIHLTLPPLWNIARFLTRRCSELRRSATSPDSRTQS